MFLKRLFDSAVEKEVEKRMNEISWRRYMDERIDDINKRVYKLEDKLRPNECCVPVECNCCEPK